MASNSSQKRNYTMLSATMPVDCFIAICCSAFILRLPYNQTCSKHHHWIIPAIEHWHHRQFIYILSLSHVHDSAKAAYHSSYISIYLINIVIQSYCSQIFLSIMTFCTLPSREKTLILSQELSFAIKVINSQSIIINSPLWSLVPTRC